MGDLVDFPPDLRPFPGGGVQKTLDYAGQLVLDAAIVRAEEGQPYDADQLAALNQMLLEVGYARFLADRFVGYEGDQEAYIKRWIDGLTSPTQKAPK